MKLEPKTPKQLIIVLSVVFFLFLLAGYVASAFIFQWDVNLWPQDAKLTLSIYFPFMLCFYFLSISEFFKNKT